MDNTKSKLKSNQMKILSNQWYDIKEQLPPFNKRVLFYNKATHYISIGSMTSYDHIGPLFRVDVHAELSSDNGVRRGQASNLSSGITVTHWMWIDRPGEEGNDITLTRVDLYTTERKLTI